MGLGSRVFAAGAVHTKGRVLELITDAFDQTRPCHLQVCSHFIIGASVKVEESLLGSISVSRTPSSVNIEGSGQPASEPLNGREARLEAG